jgi:hypothetical protein
MSGEMLALVSLVLPLCQGNRKKRGKFIWSTGKKIRHEAKKEKSDLLLFTI